VFEKRIPLFENRTIYHRKRRITEECLISRKVAYNLNGIGAQRNFNPPIQLELPAHNKGLPLHRNAISMERQPRKWRTLDC